MDVSENDTNSSSADQIGRINTLGQGKRYIYTKLDLGMDVSENDTNSSSADWTGRINTLGQRKRVEKCPMDQKENEERASSGRQLSGNGTQTIVLDDFELGSDSKERKMQTATRSPVIERSTAALDPSDLATNQARLPDRNTQVVVIGGGIAGIWAALKLISRGIPTVLITYTSADRGGVQGATVKSVGAINTGPLEEKDFSELLDKMSHGQANSSIGRLMQDRLRNEIESLKQFSDLEQIQIGVRLAKGDSRRLLSRLYQEFESCGGRIVDGWVTRIVADSNECRGVQYQSHEGIGKLRSKFIVVASGGYAGLFDGSVQTACYGTVLGQFMQSGGVAVNLEFLFKHGYGKPDMGQLTPTEQLCGAEVLDQDGNHITWLERELFNGNGTKNHHRALRFWRDNKEHDFYVSFRRQPIFEKLKAITQLAEGSPEGRIPFRQLRQLLQNLLSDTDHHKRSAVRKRVVGRLRDGEKIDYDLFCEIREHCSLKHGQRPTRIRQIAYFTMGGIANDQFKTNLFNTFVTGEAMHDFGANRVGGLPWGLYLVAGDVIAEQIANRCSPQADIDFGHQDFDLVENKAEFDAGLLQKLRSLLFENQEQSFSADKAKQAIHWIQTTRRRIIRRGDKLSDAISWLVVAEAIFKSSLTRRESRGCFMRDDFLSENNELRDCFTYCCYDEAADNVECCLIAKTDYERFFQSQTKKEKFHAHA